MSNTPRTKCACGHLRSEHRVMASTRCYSCDCKDWNTNQSPPKHESEEELPDTKTELDSLLRTFFHERVLNDFKFKSGPAIHPFPAKMAPEIVAIELVVMELSELVYEWARRHTDGYVAELESLLTKQDQPA